MAGVREGWVGGRGVERVRVEGSGTWENQNQILATSHVRLVCSRSVGRQSPRRGRPSAGIGQPASARPNCLSACSCAFSPTHLDLDQHRPSCILLLPPPHT